MTQVTFAAIGDNTIDEYAQGTQTQSFVGGNAVNVAVQLRRLGQECRYAGAVGDDVSGRRIREALDAQRVLTADLVVLPGHTSTSRVVVLPDGDRYFEWEDFGVCADYRPGAADLEPLRESTVVHIGMLP